MEQQLELFPEIKLVPPILEVIKPTQRSSVVEIELIESTEVIEELGLDTTEVPQVPEINVLDAVDAIKAITNLESDSAVDVGEAEALEIKTPHILTQSQEAHYYFVGKACLVETIVGDHVTARMQWVEGKIIDPPHRPAKSFWSVELTDGTNLPVYSFSEIRIIEMTEKTDKTDAVNLNNDTEFNEETWKQSFDKRQREQSAKSINQVAALRLLQLIQSISERCFYSLWHSEIDQVLATAVLTNTPRNMGCDLISQDDIEELKSLHDECSGWWRNNYDEWLTFCLSGIENYKEYIDPDKPKPRQRQQQKTVKKEPKDEKTKTKADKTKAAHVYRLPRPSHKV